MSHILRTSTEHKTASLADEGNSAYCQSSGAHNIKHISINLWKLTLRGQLNTDVQATLCSREQCLNHSATAPRVQNIIPSPILQKHRKISTNLLLFQPPHIIQR